jgi:hypothetical protein
MGSLADARLASAPTTAIIDSQTAKGAAAAAFVRLAMIRLMLRRLA